MARAQVRSSSGVTARGSADGDSAAPATAGSSSSGEQHRAQHAGGSLISRRVTTMRCSAVTLARIARTQSAGSSRSSKAPAIRQIMRSGRSITPTLHSMPIDSARAFV